MRILCSKQPQRSAAYGRDHARACMCASPVCACVSVSVCYVSLLCCSAWGGDAIMGHLFLCFKDGLHDINWPFFLVLVFQ